ncbi:restriction endonuclease subunit S [Salinimicrobium sp. HB62]|uniref:restriction endonuclease subunit S n=1 Tax=Salinimicrobium sp. HB62 TaxID=3077781 RepID=UPI002D771A01|nr:restriction endonuclease subunit S [Salinimicrobium sp. HB62]
MEGIKEKVRLQKYPAYKHSGVEWLGEIPEHWDLKRLGSRFEERKEKVSDKDFPPLSVTKKGILPQLDNAAKSNDGDNRKLVRKGDFVINSRSDRKGSSGISDLDGSVSLINIVMKPKDLHGPFSDYLLKSTAFVEENYRIGHGIVADLWTTRYDEMKNIKAAFPPKEEQTAIASFLDEKCGKIDTAITQKEKLIELLKERKQIIIQNAVTKGLDPKVKMKDSGVEWIGGIPVHWEVVKLGHCLLPVSEKNHPNLPLLSITREKGVILRDIEDQDSNHNFIPEDLSGYKKIRKGQFGMNKMKAWQGSYGVSAHTGIVSPAYFIFDILIDVDPEFFHFALRSKLYVSFFGQASDGVRIGQWDLSKMRMKQIPFVYPSKKEQRTIVAEVKNQLSQTAHAIKLQKQQIRKLEEYKRSLIDAAVTGKIKVS